ncbi:uncharacterized protein LOC131314853 [Rhododendron vialii]|uniref:uncharacterized protein LOC131314853 n=1 Tax=Rhododendron vialii TaxID=182163 RepID=UPI00265E912B|nr:uncharacterized protein LOC131314853 [Rhododendron vialii]
MQSILNLHSNRGLPLCLSGITHPLSLSKEMADHDRRREALKKKKRGIVVVNYDVGIVRNHERGLEEIRGGDREVEGDLVADLVHDLIYLFLACPAKAA